MGILDVPRVSRAIADATYAPLLKPDTGAQFMSKVRLGIDATCGLAGDSTGNGSDEWYDLLATTLGTSHVDSRVEIAHWNDTTQANDAATIVQAGTSGSTGVVFHDTFTRTAADIYQSIPDIGPAWGRDGSNASGDWSLDGTDAVRSSDSTTGGTVATVEAGEMTTWISANFSTLQTGTARSFRLYSQRKDPSNSLYLSFTVNASGVPSFSINKNIGGSASAIATASSIASVTTNAASNELTLELSLSGSTVTGKVNSQTLTTTLTAGDLTALSGATTAGMGPASSGSAGDKVHEFKVTIGTPAAPVKATFYNASMSGSALTYQQSRLAAMFPVSLDVLFISSCHNYGSDTPAQYATKLDSFIAAFKAVQPAAGIIICSQNPQKAPATGKAAHLARLASLSSYAARRGYGYIPVAETWAAQIGGGVSLINTDGVHPTNGASGTGSSLWRDTTLAYLNSV